VVDYNQPSNLTVQAEPVCGNTTTWQIGRRTVKTIDGRAVRIIMTLENFHCRPAAPHWQMKVDRPNSEMFHIVSVGLNVQL